MDSSPYENNAATLRCQIEKREQCNQMVKVEGIIYQSRKADFPFNETHTRLLNCNVLNPSPIINPLLSHCS